MAGRNNEGSVVVISEKVLERLGVTSRESQQTNFDRMKKERAKDDGLTPDEFDRAITRVSNLINDKDVQKACTAETRNLMRFFKSGSTDLQEWTRLNTALEECVYWKRLEKSQPESKI